MKKGTRIVNFKTGKVIEKAEPVDEEVYFDGGVMITETDLKGVITYVNKKFREMTGYTREELIGAPHSIIRHPDMPKGAFRSMWETLKEGKIWRGYVKNLRKDGKYYWVLVYVQPKYDENGDVVGYIAGRKVADPQKVKQAEMMYEQFGADELADEEIFDCSYHEYIESK
ncbi:PAS domain-containing protein [Hydrogenimonas sp. SS33]|uniref:PAS domain-containing protein n=1 Tax=Hydrogenimonas leucolamina TaxID=2954236 RepID=UPI00336C08DD